MDPAWPQKANEITPDVRRLFRGTQWPGKILKDHSSSSLSLSLSAKSSKEEVRTLPSSKHFRLCQNSFNVVLWFRLHSWNITAAGYWKMQISHIFRFQMQHSFLSQQKVGNIYIYRIFYYNSKIHSLKKKNPDNIGGKKKKVKLSPFHKPSMLITFFSCLRPMLLDFSYDYLNLYPFSFKCLEVVPLYAFQAK